MSSTSSTNGHVGQSSSGKPLKLKALLFDVDGTMADTDVFHRQVFKDLLKPYGIDCDDVYYNKNISGKANTQLHQQLVPHLSKPDATALFEDKESKFRTLSKQQLKPLSGLIHLLQHCKAAGIKVAAVTNAPRPNVEFMLTLFGLASDLHPISPIGSAGHASALDTIVMGEDCTEAKPSPEPYLTAMQRLGVSPNECIVFEDSTSGVTAGVASGCQTICVLTTKSEEEAMKMGCYGVIHDYTEIDIDAMMYEMKDYIKHHETDKHHSHGSHGQSK